jgi:hypothetical protein
MTMMQDWSFKELPGEDLANTRDSFARVLGRIAKGAIALLFAAIPVIDLLAPGVIPRFR